MSNEGFALSLRIPADAHEALEAYAGEKGVTVSDALLTALYDFLVAQEGTTKATTRKRMTAEVNLTTAVLKHAKEVKKTDYPEDATLRLFDWIQSELNETYHIAIGPNAEHAYRINPQIARRFAMAIGAEPVPDPKGNPAKEYLPRNANKLIKSYTPLRKKSAAD